MKKACVLAVVTMLIMCVGVLVPAINKVRDAANRLQCEKHLQSIGIGVLNYHDVNQCFPTAVVPHPTLPPEERLSWHTSLLPHMEIGVSGLFHRLDFKQGWEGEANLPVASVQHLVFQCPSFPRRQAAGSYFLTTYVGLAGLGPEAASLPKGHSQAGFFGYERELTRDDIRTGTSTLLIVIETAQVSGAWTAGGNATVRGLDPTGPPYLGTGGQFGGLHQGDRANALFADGSVRFLEPSNPPKVFEGKAVLPAQPAGVK